MAPRSLFGSAVVAATLTIAPVSAVGDGVRAPVAAVTGPDVIGVIGAHRVLRRGVRPQTLGVTMPGSGGRAALRVELVALATERVVRSWPLGLVARGPAQTITWDGKVAGGRSAPDGRYRFRAAVGSASATWVAEPFVFLRAFFPVRGTHEYGDGLGASRGHQGQDVMAPCGTPLVAARGGVVEQAGYRGAAGNRVVVAVGATGSTDVYMHLRATPRVRAGQTIVAGQRLGEVGATGRATACHLHFEEWQGEPYVGGRVLDPTADLQAWDAQTGAGLRRPSRAR